MKATKYSFNKTQRQFVETTNPQQSRFYKNVIVPATHQKSIHKKPNTTIISTESYHFIRENSENIQNNNQCYQNSHKLNTAGMEIFNPNSSNRQRFAPYPSHKRSYAHAMTEPTNICYYNYQPQIQQQEMSSNQLNLVNRKSLTTYLTETIYRYMNRLKTYTFNSIHILR